MSFVKSTKEFIDFVKITDDELKIITRFLENANITIEEGKIIKKLLEKLKILNEI